MITKQDLETKWWEYQQALNAWLMACQQHDDRLVTYETVKAARRKADKLEAAFNKANNEYQQQAMNARPAR